MQTMIFFIIEQIKLQIRKGRCLVIYQWGLFLTMQAPNYLFHLYSPRDVYCCRNSHPKVNKKALILILKIYNLTLKLRISLLWGIISFLTL